MTRRNSRLFAAAILVAACSAPIFAQQETAEELQAKAAQGDADAQYNLGILYANGTGVPQNDAEAARWYRLAAEQGEVVAQFDLGVLYANGFGVPQDDAEAARWYRLASDQGYALAQWSLGASYGGGFGVPVDPIRAYMWINLAGSQLSGENLERVMGLRDRLEGSMTTDQIAEAQRLAREWTPTNVPSRSQTEDAIGGW